MPSINIDNGEKVVAEFRRHWYVLATESAFITLLALIPFFVLATVGALPIPDNVFAILLFLSLSWLLILWSIFFIIWTNYFLDVWILTDKKIIDIEQISLFSREVSEFRLDRVQDITVEVKGIIPTMLKFGTLHVQTAGATREFIIKSIPHPYEVRDQIMDWHGTAMKTLSAKKDG